MALPHARDLLRVMKSYVESGSTVQQAQRSARSAGNKKHIRTFVPPDVGQRLMRVRDKYQKLSDDFVKRGLAPFFL